MKIMKQAGTQNYVSNLTIMSLLRQPCALRFNQAFQKLSLEITLVIS
ncbi:hypothetical protein DSOL_4196 [Desulfosporosinus metallidurans]|uniref:Uncharacterized protein n=1 Tax=Desulfosporosinus metallidurans TaxID=1888891 RepID=A0A1Q8QLG6_9FIRM|nr:hypothetical protein DSOL_4196 [Desulfosporosinus metallidurans]